MEKGINKQSFPQNGISIYSTFCELLKLNSLEMIEMCFDWPNWTYFFIQIFSLRKKNMEVIFFILVLRHSSISGGGEIAKKKNKESLFFTQG